MNKQPENSKLNRPAAVGSGAWLGICSITLNCGIVLAVWLAVNGNVPCGYVTKFMAAATLILSPLCLLALINPTPPAPLREAVSHVSDALTVAILVWHGWLWCAGAFAWGWLCCLILFAARKQHAAKMPNAKLTDRIRASRAHEPKL